jgi:uncharacterized ferritin-like protein (DUF455 family)
MIASQAPKTQVLVEPQVYEKLRFLDSELHALLMGERRPVPERPGRDVQIWPIHKLPPKKGLSFREGQARLLHDLASIELQAMELAVRTLIEFPEAPAEFRDQLAEIARDEGRHLALCLRALEDLTLPWGSFPTHIGLWTAVHGEDSLLDRILIVHRYLEGSGLDASDTFLRRLDGVNAPVVTEPVRVIRQDEVAHVLFGSRWYHEIAKSQMLDPEQDFANRMLLLAQRLPRRKERISWDIRRQVGFTDLEIQALEQHQLQS